MPHNLCSQSPLLQNARAGSCRARPCRDAMRLTVVRSQATPLGSDSIHKTCEEKKDTLHNLNRTATSKTPS